MLITIGKVVRQVTQELADLERRADALAQQWQHLESAFSQAEAEMLPEQAVIPSRSMFPGRKRST